LGTFLVIALSVAVGLAAYAATMRNGRRGVAVGFDGASATATMPEPEETEGGEIVHLGRTGRVADELPEAPERRAGTFPESTGTLPPVYDEPTVALAPGDAERQVPALARRGASALPPPEPGNVYLQVGTGGPTWRDRLAGVIGLAVLLILGSAAVAFALYQVGNAINQTFQRFLGS
jgi:hypothetical protein